MQVTPDYEGQLVNLVYKDQKEIKVIDILHAQIEHVIHLAN